MIYFLKLRCSPGEPLGQVVIGTEKSIPRYLDGRGHHRERYVVDGRYHGPRNPGEWLRAAGQYARSFHPPRQMEGGSAEYRAIAVRFAHLKVEEHLFRLGPDLVEFIAEQTVEWTGDDATAIGCRKDRAEGREVPVSNGLAGRLRRRSG